MREDLREVQQSNQLRWLGIMQAWLWVKTWIPEDQATWWTRASGSDPSPSYGLTQEPSRSSSDLLCSNQETWNL